MRGFTLLELMLVLSVAGVLVAIMAPAMATLTQRESLVSEAHAVAQKVAAAREGALADGRCYGVYIRDDHRGMTVNRFPDRNCDDAGDVSANSVTGDLITLTADRGGTGMVPGHQRMLIHALPSSTPTLDMDAANHLLVWLPNGWMRGDNFATPESNVTDDRWVVTLSDSRLPPDSRRVVVVATAAGLVCVNLGGGVSCP